MFGDGRLTFISENVLAGIKIFLLFLLCYNRSIMTIHDVIIIGGGPAGCSAAVYAARKRLKTLLIAKEWGGQSTVSTDIQNWIGTPHISGEKLSENLKDHVLEYKSDVLAVKEFFGVSSISGSYPLFTVETEDGETF